MPDVYKNRITLKILEYVFYVPDALSTRCRRAAIVKRAFHTRLGHVTEAIHRKIDRKAHVAYTDAPKTCAKRVQSVFNAPVTHMELIRNVYYTRQRRTELLETF